MSKITIEPAEEAVRVTYRGTDLANSANALILREGTYPPVFYIPKADVNWDVMQATDHSTFCPYKGTASYWSIDVDGERVENGVWAYPEAIDAVAEIKDCVAFYWNKMDAWYLGGRHLSKPEF